MSPLYFVQPYFEKYKNSVLKYTAGQLHLLTQKGNSVEKDIDFSNVLTVQVARQLYGYKCWRDNNMNKIVMLNRYLDLRQGKM